jgi:16S rRNA (guanine966-N2)-methyltransferase
MSIRVYGNRALKTLPGDLTRPTAARVREALFNIWQGEIAGCRWLDLCAGSGAMGAEALGRGAQLVVGIEQSNRACGVIQQNWLKLASAEQLFEILRGDVVAKLKQLDGQTFDRIYFDPPYASSLYQPVLAAIAQHQLLSETGEMAVEHDPQRSEMGVVPGLRVVRSRIYGNTALTFYQRSDIRHHA